ncbi:MFS transporter [Lederbergia citrea]|uniref:MFS transporter n=1 Tax=Lederbergia citrea TaxID=2833581 RepID=UPI001BC9746D|nr:MFS transporter [Lederbergia citrea]MBS4204829.1 MFS transporter [Lederbergia citrea]
MNSKPLFWNLKGFLFLVGAMNTFVVSYFPLYFKHVGLTTSEIGMLLALGTFVGLFGQPFWGLLSDKYKTVKRIMNVVILGSVLGLVWIFQLSQIGWIFVAGSFFYLFYNALFPLSENLTKRIADQNDVSFGSIRSWAAVGFALVSLVSGFLFAKIGIQYLAFPMIFLGIMTFLLSLRLTDAKTGTKKMDFKQMGTFFKNPTLLLFFFLLSFISITHRTNDSFISLYLFDIGGDETLVGWLWFMAVASEAIMFFTATLWFRPEKPIHYIILAGFLYMGRWIVIGFISNPFQLIMIQALHGVCYAIFFMGAIEYLYKRLPIEMQATGHMVFMLIVYGVTGIIGSFAGGFIFDAFGGATLYFIMAALTFIGTAGLVYFNGRRVPVTEMASE